MFYRFFVFLMLTFFVTGCFEGDNSAKGFWVSAKRDSIIEFTPSKAVITLCDGSNRKITMDYESIDSSHYRLKSEDTETSLVFFTDKASATLKADNSVDSTFENTYLRAPSIGVEDIVGKWYDKEQDGDEENIYIITQRQDSYDYETITLNHKEKTFKKEIEKNIQFRIENGFIFVDLDSDGKPEADDNYVYYLASYTKDTMNFTDSDGYKWSEQKLQDSSDIAIPEGYVLVK